MTVRAGDLVQVSIVRDGRRWAVAFVDRTAHAKRTLLITSATVSANRAEWVQEDPTPGAIASSDLPYPIMAAPVFTDLLLNRLQPMLPYTDGQVLSTQNGTFFVPSRARHDGFVFTTPHGAARQYLIDALHFDTQYSRFVVELTRWGQLGDASRRNALRQVERAYSVSRSSLLRQHWPERARNGVAAMAKEASAVIQALRRFPPDDEGVSHAWVRTAVAFHVAVDELRASLGLPPAA
jgi:hypothetical protein